MHISVVIPTYNAGARWKEWIQSYQEQSLKADKVVVMDSSSSDDTQKLATKAGFEVHVIDQSEFNHGDTRNLAVTYCPQSDVVIFLTQDAILATSDALENLVSVFSDPDIAAVCGRQLPHHNANVLATHARLFNYPKQTKVKSTQDIPILGIKTAFMSNSFAAYRRCVFDALGQFPSNTILAEDMFLAAKMILANYKVAYCAEARVYHSHNYTAKQEFERYFDTGVFQSNEPWIQKKFGKLGGEGGHFVISEMKYVFNHAPWLVPQTCVHTLAKWLGFKLGLKYRSLPVSWCKKLGMTKNYWH